MAWFLNKAVEKVKEEILPKIRQVPDNPFPIKKVVDFLSLMDQKNEQWTSVHEMDGSIRFINKGITAILGWTPEELIGTQLDVITHPEDKANANLGHDYVNYNDQATRIEVRCRVKDSNPEEYKVMEIISWTIDKTIIALARPTDENPNY